MKRTHTAILLLVAAVLLAWCARMQPRLVSARAELDLAPGGVTEGTPPLVAFTTVILGGFRGVLADVLWLRVTRLQDEGRYFELVQLSDWITQLEPRSTGTWAFHAWNMAYNVSAMMANPDERWQWVQNGLRLLRDDALRYNPHNTRLYFELGWIFQHKFGARTDRAWLYYQQRLAVEMEALLPGGRPPADPAWPTSPAGRDLRTRQGLDPKTLLAIDAKFGPLDWRLPESQALYWAELGLERGADPHDHFCERMRYQTLAVSFAQGQLQLNPQAGLFTRGPRTELLDPVLRAYQHALAGPNARSARESLVRFLPDAATMLEAAGETDNAARARALLAEQEPLVTQRGAGP